MSVVFSKGVGQSSKSIILGSLIVVLAAWAINNLDKKVHASPHNARNLVPAQTLRDIEYARIGDRSIELDLYLPEGQGPFPVIIWIHGGGWTSGDKDLDPNDPQVRQVGRGYAVASINYRLSQEAKFPAQIEDCKAAARWLRARASNYDLDPSRIAVWGSSAGGHLAALLGTSGDVTELEGSEDNPSYSSRVSAVVDWFGPTDLLRMSADSLPFPCSILDHNSPFSPESLLIGCAIQTCPDNTDKANPIRYVSGDDPPFLIMHGDRDCLVGPRQSQRLYNALTTAGVRASLKFLPGAGHGGSEFEEAENLKLVDDFLDQNLKGGGSSKITAAAVSGKKLFVYGEKFENGSAILMDGEKQKTANDDQNPSTILVGRKAGKWISVGQTVILQVKNPDGSLSAPFSFSRQ